MNLDFHTANAAERPHVSIFDAETEAVVCEVPIPDTGDDKADIAKAEAIAERIIAALKDFEFNPTAKALPCG